MPSRKKHVGNSRQGYALVDWNNGQQARNNANHENDERLHFQRLDGSHDSRGYLGK
jgi:hypothetical protein